MGKKRWVGNRFYANTRKSGSRFEDLVVDMIRRYTNAVWRNIRVETLLTSSGSTEMDVVFCNSDVVYILELKRIRKIVGSYYDRFWKLYGWNESLDESGVYNHPNVIEQNNIHARSLMDLYFSEFECFPKIMPFIVVPNGCEIPDDLRDDVITVAGLERFVISSHPEKKKNVVVRMSYLMDDSVDVVRRKDFVDRNTKSGTTLRGRKGD